MMDANVVDRSVLRLSAALLLAGQLSYVVITLFHTGGEANHHAEIFAAYADSGNWTAVHAAQFACMMTLFAGLFALVSAMDLRSTKARLLGRLATASTTTALAIYAVVLAVDGVALKQAVNAWANAPIADQPARFAAAESMRWLEWGARSYENFALGFALMFAAIVVRSASLSRAVAALMMFSSIAYDWQGWVAGAEGFSEAHTIGIVLTEILNAIWMTWLLAIAWRMPAREAMQSPL